MKHQYSFSLNNKELGKTKDLIWVKAYLEIK